MCLIWNLIKAFTDTQDDNKKDNNDLEDWQKELVKENKYDSFNFEEEELEDDDYYSDEMLKQAGACSVFLVRLGANNSIFVADDMTTDDTSVERNNINIIT